MLFGKTRNESESMEKLPGLVLIHMPRETAREVGAKGALFQRAAFASQTETLI